MVKINNSFDGFTKTRITDAYIRNLHDYRTAVEIPSLSVIDFILGENQDNLVIPSSQFENIRPYLKYLSQTYHKRQVNFTCTDDISQYRQEYILISNLLFQSKKNYNYCLGDLIDFCWDANLSLKDIHLPKTIIYMSDKVRKEFHKYCPKDFQNALSTYQSMETQKLVDDNTVPAQNLFKNPQNLYLRLLSEIAERAINYSLLQLYDFLLEETSQTNIPLTIKSNNLIQIWDELNYISQIEYGKPSLNDKVVLLPCDKTKQDFNQNIFNRTIEEWASNLNRALDLKVKLGLDFISYLNTHHNTVFYINFQNNVYPALNSLVSFIYRKMGVDFQPNKLNLITRANQTLL